MTKDRAEQAEGLVSHVAPAGVFGADIEDGGQPVAVYPEEAAYVSGAVEKRRRDFALGRFCARSALARMGMGGAVIARDIHGAPLWPEGIVGSITHTDGYAAALVAARRCFLGVGVDAERTGGVTDDLMPRLFDTVERDWLAGLDDDARGVAATILFSAKEAWYKAWSPPAGTPLSFRTIHVELDGDGFTVTHPDEEPVRGRFAVRGDLVVTAVCRAVR